MMQKDMMDQDDFEGKVGVNKRNSKTVLNIANNDG